MKLYRAWAILAAVALVILPGWGMKNVGAKSKADAASTIVIGAAVGMTGILSPWDNAANVMEQFAVNDINAKGGLLGHKLKLVTVDTKSDRSQGGNAALEVISRGARMVIVSCDFDYGSPAALVAEQKGLINFSTCAADPKFGVRGIGPLAYTLSTGTPAQGALLAEWAYKRGWRHPYLLLDTSVEYDKSLCKYFNARYTDKDLGGKKSTREDTFTNSDPSIASQITRLKSAQPKPDVILLCSYPPGGATAFKQLRASGVNTVVLGSESMDGDYWVKVIPHLSNWYHAAYGSLWLDDRNPKVNQLIRRYMGQTHKRPTLANALTGYAVIQAYATAVRRAHSFDAQKVKAQLDKFHLVPTVAGLTTFSSKLHMSLVGRPMVIIQCQNGRFHFVQRYAAHKIPPIQF